MNYEDKEYYEPPIQEIQYGDAKISGSGGIEKFNAVGINQQIDIDPYCSYGFKLVMEGGIDTVIINPEEPCIDLENVRKTVGEYWKKMSGERDYAYKLHEWEKRWRKKKTERLKEIIENEKKLLTISKLKLKGW